MRHVTKITTNSHQALKYCTTVPDVLTQYALPLLLSSDSKLPQPSWPIRWLR